MRESSSLFLCQLRKDKLLYRIKRASETLITDGTQPEEPIKSSKNVQIRNNND